MTHGTTRRRASIIHGYSANPDDHWFGWLASRLREDGIPTTVPRLPNPQAPDRDEWEAAIRADLGTIGESTVVVAHSLGCLATLRHLQSLPGDWRLGDLVLVAGFLDPLPALPELDAFIAGGADVTGLREHIGRLTVLRSDDDQFVPTAHTDRLAELLGTSARVVPGAGHFLATDGVSSLPEARPAGRPRNTPWSRASRPGR